MNPTTFQNVAPPAVAVPTTEPTPFPPLFGPLQPINTFFPVIRPVVGLTPQEALLGGLGIAALAPAVLGQGLTLFSVPGASQLAGQLRALSFFAGLATPPAFLVRPQAPPATAGTIPFPAPGTPVQPISPLFQALTGLGTGVLNLLFPPPTTTPPATTTPPPPVAQPTPTPPQ